MAVRLDAATAEAIRRHAREGVPEEVCGLLLGRDGEPRVVVRAERAANARGDERTRRYLIDPLELVKAEERGERAGSLILGFYHSHPGSAATPSEFDRAHAWPWYSYLIVSLAPGSEGALACWRLRDDRSRFDPEPLQVR